MRNIIKSIINIKPKNNSYVLTNHNDSYTLHIRTVTKTDIDSNPCNIYNYQDIFSILRTETQSISKLVVDFERD